MCKTLARSDPVSELMTESYLIKRAAKGLRKDFEDIMSRVPDVPANPADAGGAASLPILRTDGAASLPIPRTPTARRPYQSRGRRWRGVPADPADADGAASLPIPRTPAARRPYQSRGRRWRGVPTNPADME